MELSILIVNYNGLRFIRGCLDSVRLFCPDDSETIVVDNGSNDGSDLIIECEYPWVRLERSSKNLGFVGGNNLASLMATGKYLLLLNNDTIIKDSMVELLNLIGSNENIGAVGCRLLYGDLRLQESIGRDLRPINLALSWSAIPFFSRTVSKESTKYEAKYLECDWVSGAFLLTRHSCWVELKGLDDRYFMYMEDVDYCSRLKVRGKKIVYSSLCTVIHFEGSGRPWIGEQALLNTLDSYSIYMKKYRNVETIMAWLILFLIFSLRSFYCYYKWIVLKSENHRSKSAGYIKGALNIYCKLTSLDVLNFNHRV